MKIRIEYINESGQITIEIITCRWCDDEIMSWVDSMRSRFFRGDKEVNVKVITRVLWKVVRMEGYPAQVLFSPEQDGHF